MDGLPAAEPLGVQTSASTRIAPLRWRERRLFYLLLSAWVINAFDLALTLLAYQQNLLVELNPLAARVLPHGTAAVVIYKCTMLFIGTGVLWYCRRHWATEPAVWAYLVLCVGLSFWWHRLLHEAEPIWMIANTAEKVLPEQGAYIDNYISMPRTSAPS